MYVITWHSKTRYRVGYWRLGEFYALATGLDLTDAAKLTNYMNGGNGELPSNVARLLSLSISTTGVTNA